MVGQQCSEQRPRLADRIGADDIPVKGLAFRQTVALGQAAEYPVDFRIGAKRGAGRRRIGGLAVVDEQHAPGFGDPLHAMRQAGKAGQRRTPLRFAKAQRLDGGDGGYCILKVMGSLQRWPVRLPGNFAGAGVNDIVHAPEIAQAMQGQLRLLILARENGRVTRVQHVEQARLGSSIGIKALVAIEMIGTYVQQQRDIAVEAVGQVDLIARQFEHIDTTLGQRLLGQDRNADIAAHQGRYPGAGEDMVDQRCCRRLAVGAGDPDDPVWRQGGPGLGKQFHVADDRHALHRRLARYRMAVERDAGRDNDRIISGQIGFERIGNHRLVGDAVPQFLPIVPGQQVGTAGVQAFQHCHAGAGQSEDGIAFSGKGGGYDHRSFNVANPARASTRLMIQKRITMVDSDQPSCSK